MHFADSLIVVIPAPGNFGKYYNSTNKITNYPDVQLISLVEIRPIKSYSEQVDAGIGTKRCQNNPVVPSKIY